MKTVLLLLLFSLSLAAAPATVVIERVRPNQILYLTDEPATAVITLRNASGELQKGRLEVSEEWDMTESRPLWSGPVELSAGETKAASVAWQNSAIPFGRALQAAFKQGKTTVARGVEFFQVGATDDWFRCFMINAGGTNEEKLVKTDPFIAYNNFDNHFAYMLSGYSHLAPEQPEWIGGQFNVRFDKKEMLLEIQARRALGIRAGAYTIGATGGPAGYEFARQHPDWILRDKKGAFLLAWGTAVSPTDVARKTTDYLAGWYSLLVDFGNPDVVQYGGEEIVRAIKMFGWEAVFFDGIYSLRPVFDMGMDSWIWDGQTAGRGKGDAELNRLSTICVRKTIEIIRASCPKVALWYNGSVPRPGNPLNTSFAESLKDINCGTLFEVQGGQINDPNFYGHQWRNLYEAFLNHRDAIARLPGLNDPVMAAGYLYNMEPARIMSKEEFAATRDTWTTANHIGALMLCSRMHPCVLCSKGFRPTCQFMTRYSTLLWADNIKILKDPWKQVKVESNREVWWEEGVYTRTGKEFTDTLVHIVNSPDQEEVDFKVAKDPEAARHVEVEFTPTGKPKKVQAWALQPYAYDSPDREPLAVKLKTEVDAGRVIVELPPFAYYTMVVFREAR